MATDSCLSMSDVDHYLHDPNLSLSAMIEQYEVPTADNSKTLEKKNLRCSICGARAYGYNFDRITCESCKAFFRRNALRDTNDLQCRFGGACYITVENRRHCTFCRIKKCFGVGMRKEWIRTEEEKHIKRIQLEKNRKRKRTSRPLQMPIQREPDTSNTIAILSPMDRMRINNVTHCYDQYTGLPSITKYLAPKEVLSLRLHEFYNRKKPVIINFISYFKHLPEFEQLPVDDQVRLIKQNVRLLLPINYALLKAPAHSQFRFTKVQTIGCRNNINLHSMYQQLSNSFVDFVTFDPITIKIWLVILFFTASSQSANFDPVHYEQITTIKQIQSSYTELLWLYLLERWGEPRAIGLFAKLVSAHLRLQTIIDEIDSIVRSNHDVEHLDSLMKTVLQLS